MRSASRPLPSVGFSSVPDCRGWDIEPAEPVRRYEREHPGEMIHIDIKKLGRFERTSVIALPANVPAILPARAAASWEFVPCLHR